jgi:hypothetical protein
MTDNNESKKSRKTIWEFLFASFFIILVILGGQYIWFDRLVKIPQKNLSIEYVEKLEGKDIKKFEIKNKFEGYMEIERKLFNSEGFPTQLENNSSKTGD